MNKEDFYKSELAKSLITEDQGTAAGASVIYEVEPLAKIMNIHESRVPHLPAIIFEYRDILDRSKINTYNIKPFVPPIINGTACKYLRRSGDRNFLFCPKNIPTERILDKEEDMHLFEGEKKTICASLHGLLALGLNGVNNWVTKKDSESEAEPLEDFLKLNLKSRVFYTHFDNDVAKNHRIKGAETSLTDHLISLGAIVLNVRIPLENGVKLGTDDYIVKYGFNAYKELIDEARLPSHTSIEQIEAYIKGSKSLTIREKTIKVKAVSNAVASKDEISRPLLIKYIADETGLPIDSFKSLIKGIKNEGQESKANSKGGPVVFYHDTKLNKVEELKAKVFEELKETKSFYIFNEELIKISNGKKKFITDQNLKGTLNDLFEFNIDGKFVTLPMDYVNTFLHSETFTALPKIDYLTQTMVYHNWKLVKPGYNPDSEIYFNGKNLDLPDYFLDEYPLLDKLLSGFCFLNEASRQNYMSLLLTGLNRHRDGYRGLMPFYAITGNQPGLGKSFLALLASYIITGKEVIFTKLHHDEEFEKRVAMKICKDEEIITLDNVKASQVLDSAYLDMLITSPDIETRKMHSFDNLTVKNRFIIVMTCNDAKLSDDLIARVCPIEMFWEENPRQRRFPINVKDFVKANREGILIELFMMQEKWIKKHKCKLANIDGRFPQWSSEIGGILHASGFNQFMTNYSTATTSYNQHSQEASVIFKDSLNKWLTLDEIQNLCELHNVFKSCLDKVDVRGSLGKALNKIIDSKIELFDGGHFTLKRDGKGRKVKFYAESDSAGKSKLIESGKEEIPLPSSPTDNGGDL